VRNGLREYKCRFESDSILSYLLGNTIMSGQIGSYDWEACETCTHRHPGEESCDNETTYVNSFGDIICELYEEGDYKTDEEIAIEREAEEERKRNMLVAELTMKLPFDTLI
jgi:hypothetical protein